MGLAESAPVEFHPPPPPPPPPPLQAHELEFEVMKLQRRLAEVNERLDHTNMLIDRCFGRIMVLEAKMLRMAAASLDPVPKAKARP